MARPTNYYGIYALSSILLIVVIGSNPSHGSECTRENVRACTFVNDNGCRFYKKEVTCLEDIDQSNCTDKLLGGVTYVLSLAKNGAKACPDLPEGTCYFNALAACDVDIPYHLVSPKRPDGKNVTEEQKKRWCKKFGGKGAARKECLKAIIPKCTASYILGSIELRINKVEMIEKLCANYDAEENDDNNNNNNDNDDNDDDDDDDNY